MTETNPKNPKRKPRLKLPFDNKGGDAGEWTYNNRIGLCVTIIAYLILAISFVAGKIVVGEKQHTQGMYIDLETLAALESEKDRLERELLEKQQREDNIDWRRIQNLISNENAQESDVVKGQSSEFDESTKELQEEMDSNRETYEKGLAEERAILNSKNGAKEVTERQDSKIKGRVTVSFSLVNPARTSRHLVVPAYQCEGGGEVVVEVIVNCNGRVASADVLSGGDECMRETALRAARRSRFNIDNNAPSRHKGTITYMFIPQ